MFGFMELYVPFTTSYTEIDCHPTLTTFYRNMVITLTTCVMTICLPAIRCKFGAMNSKYQMQSRLRELANPSNPPLYPPMLINVKTRNMSAQRFSNYLKTEVIKSYIDVCIMNDCYVCDNSN